MPTKPPSELEMQRAVRFLRHVENCRKCDGYGHLCLVALGHEGRWVMTYYREAQGMCKHFCEGECWADRCKGGRNQ